MSTSTPTKCQRTLCHSGQPVTYVFVIDGYDEPEEDFTLVYYCAPCVAFCITQDYFSPNEIHTLEKV